MTIAGLYALETVGINDSALQKGGEWLNFGPDVYRGDFDFAAGIGVYRADEWRPANHLTSLGLMKVKQRLAFLPARGLVHSVQRFCAA